MVTIPPVRRRRSRPSLGIALILIGLLFFGKELGIIYFSWPLILILVGLSFLWKQYLKKVFQCFSRNPALPAWIDLLGG